VSVVLPVDIYSPDQLSELVLELQDLAAQQRNIAARSKNNNESLTTSAELSQLLHQNNISPASVSALEALEKEIAAILSTAPTSHLLLAAMPTRAFKRQIIAWFRTEISPLALVTFAARSDIGGGAIVQAGSHVYDFSFRRLVIANKARIAEIAGV